MLAPEKWNTKIRSVSAIPSANAKMFDDDSPAKAGVASRIDDQPVNEDEEEAQTKQNSTGETWLAKVKSRAEVAIKVCTMNVVCVMCNGLFTVFIFFVAFIPLYSMYPRKDSIA
mgnify:CR=1 FL=1